MVYFYCIDAELKITGSNGYSGFKTVQKHFSGFHNHEEEEENEAMMNPDPLKKFKEIQDDIIEKLVNDYTLDNLIDYTFTAFNNIT